MLVTGCLLGLLLITSMSLSSMLPAFFRSSLYLEAWVYLLQIKLFTNRFPLPLQDPDIVLVHGRHVGVQHHELLRHLRPELEQE